MKYINANIFMADCHFHNGSFSVDNGIFSDVTTKIYDKFDIDLKGKKVIPGLIDIHTHGNSGIDFSNGKSLDNMMKYYAKNGITSVTPASMTLPVDTLEHAFVNARQFSENRPDDCARLVGINMEGPFFSYNKRGAQNPDYLLNPDVEVFDKLNNACGNLIKIVCVSPEVIGGIEFVEKISKKCTVSIAHSECDYLNAKEAISKGATQLTHTFNGMNGIHHRNPGPICAGAESDAVYAELICDGLHVSPPVIRAAFKLFPGRVCIISDSLSCCGLPNGDYESGGLKVILKDSVCKLVDGTLAGSVCNAFEGMKNVISFGIDEEEAIRSATINPAIQSKCYESVGSIERGKYADFIICDDYLNLETVFIGGIKI